MFLTLTNVGTEPEPLVSPDGTLATVLHSHVAFDLRAEDVGVAVIGDKPDMRDVIRTAAGALGKVARELLTLILGRKQHAEQRGESEEVAINIANHGGNPVRVILGDGVTDVTVNPGTARTLKAPGYMEIRELGTLNNAEQPEAP